MKLALVVLSLVASTGCQGARCVEVSRSLVTDPSTPLSIGGTYDDVLTTITGERSGTIQWLDSEPYTSGFPAPGEASLTVTIHEPLEAWDVRIRREGGGYERLACPVGRLETELEVELVSDDGVLDAHLTVPAEFDQPYAVTELADVTDEELGALRFDPSEDGASLLLELSYDAEHGVAGGSLRFQSALDDGFATLGTSVALATWTLE